MIGFTLWGLMILYTFWVAFGMATGLRKPDYKIRPRTEQVGVCVVSGVVNLIVLLLVFNGV